MAIGKLARGGLAGFLLRWASGLRFPYPLRFLLVSNPQVVTKVLGIVNRVISTYLIKKAGFKKAKAHTGAVTLIQRFGSASGP